MSMAALFVNCNKKGVNNKHVYVPELKLWLDSYNDIYSDFGSHHHLKRRISEDFLHELRTEMKFREGHTAEMVLLLPHNQRDELEEKTIIISLTEFFTRQFCFYKNRCRKKLNKGLLFFIIGTISMLLNLWISYDSKKSFWVMGLKILLEPAGWLLMWAAFDLLFYDFPALKRERRLFDELKGTKIRFDSS